MVSAFFVGETDDKDNISLNPYYTGRWFLLTDKVVDTYNFETSLNPYYTGRWFLLELVYDIKVKFDIVLILIILEDGFCYLFLSFLQLL